MNLNNFSSSPNTKTRTHKAEVTCRTHEEGSQPKGENKQQRIKGGKPYATV